MHATPPHRREALVGFVLLLALAALLPPSGAAQEAGRLEGVVLDAATGRPLDGVVLRVAPGDLERITGPDGAFRFDDVPPGRVSLAGSREGYVAFTDEVVVQARAARRLEIRLETLAAALGEIQVVAGRRPGGSPRPLPPVASVGELLVGEAAVAVLRHARPGGPSAFRVRGLKSLAGSSAPAIWVDGVRIRDFEGAEGPAVPATGILDLIPPESIDSVRVIHGPSAAADRGGATANGVILVYTKKGGPGGA